VHPDYDASISCIPTCAMEGTLPRFPEISASIRIRNKIEQSRNAA
jgi:hypothetical protein